MYIYIYNYMPHTCTCVHWARVVHPRWVPTQVFFSGRVVTGLVTWSLVKRFHG